MAAEFDERAVTDALTRRLAAPHIGGDGIVWVQDGDEVAVWLDTLSVQLEPGLVRVLVDLETAQTGRAQQEVVIAVGDPAGAGSLLAVTGETARGDGRLAARWGQALQDAVWGTLIELAGGATGIAATHGILAVQAQGPE